MMRQWLNKIKREAEAPSATVWMASTKSPKGSGQTQLITVNQETLRYLEIFFGGFCVLLLALAILSWAETLTSLNSLLIISAFVLVNLIYFYFGTRRTISTRILILHPLLGGIISTLAYLWVDGNLAPWWFGFAVMCFSGVILVGLYTQSPKWGRRLVGFYLMVMLGVALWTRAAFDWYRFLTHWALIAIMGGMLAQIMSILSQSLSKIYQRSVKLRHAKEELQELDRLKTEFFADVSHEFRTPITLTLGPLEGILRGRYGQVSDTIQNHLKVVIRNQQRLLGLINQILDSAKIEAGMAELKVSRMTDVNQFVGERGEQFKGMALEKGLQFKTSFDPLLAGTEIYIDKEKFDKIIFNLLSNALKFTEKGSVQLSTEISGNHFILRVEDTGGGIPEDQLPQIFERFRQASSGATTKQKGTGIGLHLVQEYAKLHGGDVQVKSRLGRGTLFEVKVPVGKSHLSPSAVILEAGEEEASISSLAPSTPAPEREEKSLDLQLVNREMASTLDSKKSTILFVDDNPDLQYYVRDLLTPHYNVFVGSNGKEGLEMAREYKPHLILSDLMMPIMDGNEFCKAVREDQNLMSIPFVLLTARSPIESKLEGLESGADDYLIKPFSEVELLTRVKNLITLRKNQLELKRELEAAQAIQLTLLPTRPQHYHGATLDFLYHPCQELSGDFCDIYPLGEWIYFYVADVTSHGTASAQVTYLLKEIFRNSLKLNHDHQPPDLSKLMFKVGRQYASLKLAYDVGIQVCRYHLQNRTIQFLRGNAPIAVRLRPGGKTSVLQVQPSPTLSAFWSDISEAAPLPIKSAELQEGEAVYFYTDGCYEFPVEGSEFGKRKFIEILQAHQGSDWSKDVYEALVRANQGTSFPDDITILRLHISKGR